MKLNLFIMATIMVSLCGCDQKQAQMLEVRQEFEKQIQAKDKDLDELKKKNVELEQQNGQLQAQAAKAQQPEIAPEKLASSVAEIVCKRIEQENAEIKSKLDQVLAATKGGGSSMSQAPVSQTQAPPQTQIEQPVRQNPAPVRQVDPSGSDPNHKKIKINWN